MSEESLCKDCVYDTSCILEDGDIADDDGIIRTCERYRTDGSNHPDQTHMTDY